MALRRDGNADHVEGLGRDTNLPPNVTASARTVTRTVALRLRIGSTNGVF
jgi:hypothetical protein